MKYFPNLIYEVNDREYTRKNIERHKVEVEKDVQTFAKRMRNFL
jgi:hypothetical protein